MTQEIMTHEQINAHAKAVLDTLMAGLPERWGTLVLPQVCAGLFQAMPDMQPTDIRHFQLENMFDSFIGQAIHARLPDILELASALEKNGFGEENALEVCNDTYIYAVARGDGAVKVKAFVLETRNGNFIIVLNSAEKDQRTLHVRRVYPELKDEIENDGFLDGLEDYQDRKNLNIHDVVRLAKYAEKFADDVEGNAYPARWSLKSFLQSDLVVGLSCCMALRYGRIGDDGYVVSLTYKSRTEPVVEGISNIGHATIEEVMMFLAIAHREIVESPDEA